MADSALAVAQCSHLALDAGCLGLRQLANAAEQGQRASSSNPLRLYLISHRAVTECGHSRRFYLYSPGTVQYSIPTIIAPCAFTLLCAQHLGYPPTLVDFLWGICPEQC